MHFQENMLHVNFNPMSDPYKMWNQTEAQPLGTCQMTVKNPKTGGQYTVPFVVFQGNLKPVLGYETCLKRYGQH